MKTILFIFFLSQFICFSTFSQNTSSLRINFIPDNEISDYCYGAQLINETDTFNFQADIYEPWESYELKPGLYSLNLYSCSEDSTNQIIRFINKKFVLEDSLLTELNIYLNDYKQIEFDTDHQTELIENSKETQFRFSYFNNKWNVNDQKYTKYNFDIGLSQYFWKRFSKNVGFLVGGGLGYTYSPLYIDKNLKKYNNQEVIKDFYSYFNCNIDFKIRFSTTNQRFSTIPRKTLYFDIGTMYNIPLYLRNISKYDFNTKLVNSYINKYTDLKLYSNIGTDIIQLFMEYRLFDLFIGEFQELPKYNLGVKLMIH
jgi:hypothetical protein